MTHLFNKQELEKLVKEHSLGATRRLSQHFLLDESTARAIADEALAQNPRVVVEVGPGLGQLTRFLAGNQCKATVFAIEKDPRFTAFLKKTHPKAAHINQLYILGTDALTLDVYRELRSFVSEDALSGLLVFVSNLPYSAGSVILKRYISMEKPVFGHFVVMLQKEVADRLLKVRGESVLSLWFSNYIEDVSKLLAVPAASFWPEPKVDSTVINMRRRQKPLLEPDIFAKTMHIIEHAFLNRRKKIHNALVGIVPDADIKSRLLKAGINTDVRPEDISLLQWEKLIDIKVG